MPNVTAQTLLFAIHQLDSNLRKQIVITHGPSANISGVHNHIFPEEIFSLMSTDAPKCSYKNSSEVSFGSGNSRYSTHQDCTFQI